METLYEYRVTHRRLGTVRVVGKNRLTAVQRAAKHWGMPWTELARNCVINQTGTLMPTEERDAYNARV